MADTTADSRPAALAIAPLSPAWRWLAAAAAVFLCDLVLHLPITDVCDALVRRFGFETFDLAVRCGFLALGAVVVAAVALRRSSQAHGMLGAIALLVILAFVFQRTILVSGIENIHYPQYALMVWLLMAGGMRGEAAYLTSGALGVADEAYQLATMPRGTPGYFDWNDVTLNALGAAFGVVLVLGLRRSRRESLLPGRRVWVALIVATVLAFALAAPIRGPFFSVTPGGRVFHKLAAAEAVIVAGALWLGIRGAISRTTRGDA